MQRVEYTIESCVGNQAGRSEPGAGSNLRNRPSAHIEAYVAGKNWRVRYKKHGGAGMTGTLKDWGVGAGKNIKRCGPYRSRYNPSGDCRGCVITAFRFVETGRTKETGLGSLDRVIRRGCG